MKTINILNKRDLLNQKDYIEKVNEKILRHFKEASFTPIKGGSEKSLNGEHKIKNFYLENRTEKNIERTYVTFDIWSPKKSTYITLWGYVENFKLTKFEDGKKGGMIQIIATSSTNVLFKIELKDDRR